MAGQLAGAFTQTPSPYDIYSQLPSHTKLNSNKNKNSILILYFMIKCCQTINS